YQRLDTARDLNIAVVGAEQLPPGLPSWLLPAGPWREGLGALGRADLIVVTRKRVDRAVSRALADRLVARWPDTPVAEATLALGDLVGMRTGTGRRSSACSRRRPLALATSSTRTHDRLRLEDRPADADPPRQGPFPRRGEPVRGDDGALRPCGEGAQPRCWTLQGAAQSREADHHLGADPARQRGGRGLHGLPRVVQHVPR